MIRVLKISGSSMEPAYRNGDFILILRPSFLWNGIQPGDIIVFRHPAYEILVKKVKIITDAGKILVEGTKGNSVDSRKFGPIDREQVIGKVIFRISSPREVLRSEVGKKM